MNPSGNKIEYNSLHPCATKRLCVLLSAVLYITSFTVFPALLNAEEEPAKGKKTETELTEKEKENILKSLPKDVYNYLKDRPEELLKYIKKREWYKHREKESVRRKGIRTVQDDADVSAIKDGTSEEINNIVVLVGEIPSDGENAIFAPIFLSDQKKVFGTITDLSFKWVGYKATLGLKQKGFPWEKTDLSEIFIGSFLYASGTNIGFNRGKMAEENRFYTNYTSEIITLKRRMPWQTGIAFTLDSRQYFFQKRKTPEGFIMPENHVNIFPRLDLSLDSITEKGIDQLTEGIGISAWAGYGIRSRWDKWGEPGNYETGKEARTFIITSCRITAGYLYNNDQNLVVRASYKGGIDNDFITRPRFGGTIDNAQLDVVHGFTLDQFRVNRYALINARYGFNIVERLRVNLFLDYARIFSPETADIFGSGYGFRVIAWGGLPIWLTHGIGKIYREGEVEQVFMIMSAAGW